MNASIAFILTVLSLISVQSSANWNMSISCENNSVRLDRDGKYFQLVIEHEEGMQHLINAGAINSKNIIDGKIILTGTWTGASWNYFSTIPRDNGVLVYQIMSSSENKTLDVAVSWRAANLPSSTYVPSFTGHKFYNCHYLP